MTQLGEAVTVAMFLDKEEPCPFSHDPPPERNIRNRLHGKGSWLKSAMEQEEPTFADAEADAYEKEKAMPNPKANPRHPFHASRQPAISITLERSDDDEEVVRYPVSCAAHHLVPAQESLKESDLTEYMIKKGESGGSAKVRTGKSFTNKTGKCWSNVGYEVNGSQNGVWLPGSYAVHGEAWVPLVDEEDDAEDLERALDTDKLTGGVMCDERRSRKWRYVKQVVEKASTAAGARGYGGQFHDRHEPYSDFVVQILQALHQRLQNKERKNIVDEKCPDCSKRKSEMEKKGIPTPFDLVVRLNLVSMRLEEKLKGTLWHPGLYTSEWGNAYIQHLQSKKRKRS